jgi:ribosomal RNA-processing protein 12
VQVIRTRLLQLWSLLPELCFLGVTDTAQSFPKLAPILEAAMKDEKYPELLPHIVVALTHIARVARERCPLRPEAPPADSPEVAALKTQAQVFLPAVLSFLEGATVGDSRFQNGVQCIAAWAAVAPPAMISAVCKRLLQLLLSSTTASSASMDSADADAASVWMAVVQVMIPHMPDTMVTLLYRTVRPLLSINESVSMQKRAYAVLDSLLKSHGALLTNMESRLQILSVVSESLLVCNVSARTMRLRCMETLMEGMTDADFNEAARSILGEVLICQKDANKKSREGAMAVLDAMIKRVPSQELLLQLCAGIAGETSVMRSAAITGLCLLFHQKREPALLQYAAGLLPTVCLLLREECPEMTRSVLSFLKVCSAVLPTNGLLESVLPQLVEAFTSGLGPHKGKFASRSRAIMRKLSQRMDGEALKALLPEADQAQLGYIQKQARRAQRKKTSRDAETLSLSQVDRFLGSDSDDSDDEDKDRDRKAAATASSNKASGREDPRLQQRPKATKAADVQDSFSSSLEDLLDDQPSTFLNHAQKSVAAKEKAAIPGGKGKGQSVGGGAVRPDDEDEEYTVTVTADGQVVVKQRADDSAADKAAADSDRLLGPGGRKTARSEAEAGTDGASAQPQKKARVREPGEEYRSKKAGGDVWKRGMLEPHAFIPLDPRMLNKKKEKEAVAHFGILVKNGRKARVSGGVGAAGRNSKGTQASRKKRRSMKEHAADRKK